MLSVGITGQNGFIGQHLYNSIGLETKKFKIIDFEKEIFKKKKIRFFCLPM